MQREGRPAHLGARQPSVVVCGWAHQAHPGICPAGGEPPQARQEGAAAVVLHQAAPLMLGASEGLRGLEHRAAALLLVRPARVRECRVRQQLRGPLTWPTEALQPSGPPQRAAPPPADRGPPADLRRSNLRDAPCRPAATPPAEIAGQTRHAHHPGSREACDGRSGVHWPEEDVHAILRCKLHRADRISAPHHRGRRARVLPGGHRAGTRLRSLGAGAAWPAS
jgi:hypothetical protein